MGGNLMRLLILTVLLLGAQVGFAANCVGGGTGSACKTCDPTNDVCDACNDGYYILDPDTSIDCAKCPTGCSTCATSGSGSSLTFACTACTPGYYIDTGSCKKCDPACKTCTGSTNALCTDTNSCNDGYYSSGATTCSPCHGSCKKCTGGNAADCGANNCADGHFYDTGDSECKACTLGCKTCDDDTGLSTCLTCADGFRTTSSGSDVCEPCTVTNCKTCSTVATTCEACKTSYGLSADGTTCTACTGPNCDECGADQVCTKCEADYYLDSNNACQPCSGSTTCHLCKTDSDKCEECKQGTFTATDGTCKVSADKVKCEIFSASQGCAKCEDAHYRKASGYECDPCITGCLECSDGTTCTTCDTDNGYTLNSNICVTSSGEKPATCRDGTYKNDDNRCVDCDKGCSVCTGASKCTTCQQYYTDTSNTGTCTLIPGSPEEGQYLDATNTPASCEGTCRACSGGTANDCTMCRADFYPNFTAGKGTCTQCSTECASCEGTSGCSSCKEGYKFNAAGTACEATGSGFGGYIFSGAAVLISLLTLI
eukprot:TRINITY_DN10_c0_g1_i1.p1 TRINITY_DN10_c0_g1~~TRINITY_DN10_c0_g1_i1.p1  ORF type:complete len:542 (+),score=46.77 TRINITY_DN10_c0_g1_i1:120-1745(+)